MVVVSTNSSLNLTGARPRLPLLPAVARLKWLTMTDLCLRRPMPVPLLSVLLAVLLLVVGPVTWKCVRTCVSNLVIPKGPGMQLLVLVLKLVMMLSALDPVASTTTGIPEAVSTWWVIFALLSLGSTMLSRTKLGPMTGNTLIVSSLLR